MTTAEKTLRNVALALCIDTVVFATTAGGQNITSNLAAHWKLNESSGTTAADSSGNNRTGTVFGTASWQTGLLNNAIYLNGATYVRATGLIGNPANVTLAAWVNLNSADTSGAEVISIGDYVILRLDEAGTTIKGIVYKGSSNWEAVSYTRTFAGTGWHHVAVVFSDSSNYLRLYIDGTQVASVTVFGAVVYSGLGSNTHVGRHGNGGTSFDFTGRIDDARIYSRALSSSDIAALYVDGWATKSLMLVHDGASLTSQEVLRRDQFMEWGYKVSLVQDSSTQTVYNTALSDVGVVYVPEEINSGDVAYKLRETTVGVVCEEVLLHDELGFSTSSGSEATGTTVNITNNTHYITNSFSTGNLTITSWSQPLVYTNTTRASGFSSLGTVSTSPSLGVIESGGTLANSYNSSNTAFGRRVALPIGGGAFDFAALNSNGRTLVKKALEWAAAPPSSPTGLLGQWKLNESSGTTASDFSGQGNNGTFTNGVTLNASGPYTCSSSDNAADFDGVNDYVSVANENAFDVTSAVTVAAWFKVDSFTKDWQALVTKGNTAWRIQREGATNQLQFACTGLSTTKIVCTSNVNNGAWHHVVGRYDGSTLSIYINGVLEASTSVTGSIGTNNYNVAIGENLESTSRHWDGKIHDVRVYNYALSSTEISSLASGTAGVWKFSEGAGTTAADSSGAGNSATLAGGATWTSDCGGLKALQTNGSGAYAQTASNFSPPSDGTVAFWMRSNGPLSARGRLFGISNNWEARQETDGTIAFDLGTGGASNFVVTTPLSTAGTWYHVAATYSTADDTYALYVDGQLHNSGVESSGLSSQTAAKLSFGTRTGSTEYWPGAIRDFRVYSRRLCPGEIAALHGLISHWKLDELAGTAAADSSIAANNATYQGSPTLGVHAPIDYGVQFNGSNYAITNQTISPPLTGTVTYWMRRSGPASARERHLGATGDWEIWQDPDGLIRCDLGTDGNTVGFKSVTALHTPGKWYHIAACFDGVAGTYTLYVDGELEVSGSTSMAQQSSAQLTIAGRTGLSIERFQGILDDLRIYNRVLCQSEVVALFNGGDPFEGVKIIEWNEIQ